MVHVSHDTIFASARIEAHRDEGALLTHLRKHGCYDRGWMHAQMLAHLATDNDATSADWSPYHLACMLPEKSLTAH